MRKCIKCSKRFEDTVNYKGKNYCVDCYEVFMNSKATCTVCRKSYIRNSEYTNVDMETKDRNKNFCSITCYDKLVQDRLDLDELDQWLKAYHRIDKLNSRIYMQVQQFKSKNGFTTKGILLTLKYITSTLKKDLEPDTIGIVAWYYDSAKEEYIKRIKRQENALKLKSENLNMFEEKNVAFKQIIDNRKNKILITHIDFKEGYFDV